MKPVIFQKAKKTDNGVQARSSANGIHTQKIIFYRRMSGKGQKHDMNTNLIPFITLLFRYVRCSSSHSSCCSSSPSGGAGPTKEAAASKEPAVLTEKDELDAGKETAFSFRPKKRKINTTCCFRRGRKIAGKKNSFFLDGFSLCLYLL